MIIGIPAEVKIAEKRVAITPSGVRTLVKGGHEVLIQSDAGLGSGFLNENYVQSGAVLMEDPQGVWDKAEMILNREAQPIEPGSAILSCDNVIAATRPSKKQYKAYGQLHFHFFSVSLALRRRCWEVIGER